MTRRERSYDERTNKFSQASFAKIEPVAEAAAVLFYAKLFDLDPGLRRLFRADIREQGRKLMRMIGTAVKGLDRLEEIVPAVRALGARHAAYGVKDRKKYAQLFEEIETALPLARARRGDAEAVRKMLARMETNQERIAALIELASALAARGDNETAEKLLGEAMKMMLAVPFN